MHATADAAVSVVDRRDRPLPPDWTVARGRDTYLEENAFRLEGYDEPWTEAKVLGIRFKVPNTERHRTAIMLHDLHHVATGFGTDLAGEGEISAWEFRRGLRPLGLYVGAIVSMGFVMGLVVAPRRTLRAYRAAGSARRGRGSLFHDCMPATNRSYSDLMGLRIGELRERLGVPEQGLAVGRRGRHSM